FPSVKLVEAVRFQAGFFPNRLRKLTVILCIQRQVNAFVFLHPNSKERIVAKIKHRARSAGRYADAGGRHVKGQCRSCNPFPHRFFLLFAGKFYTSRKYLHYIPSAPKKQPHRKGKFSQKRKIAPLVTAVKVTPHSCKRNTDVLQWKKEGFTGG